MAHCNYVGRQIPANNSLNNINRNYTCIQIVLTVKLFAVLLCSHLLSPEEIELRVTKSNTLMDMHRIRVATITSGIEKVEDFRRKVTF